MTRTNRRLIIAILAVSLIGSILEFFGIRSYPAGKYPVPQGETLTAQGTG